MLHYRFGGNTFTDCSLPLVLEDRIFVVEPGKHGLLVTVIVIPEKEEAFAEILKNVPRDNQLSVVSKTPPGILTVTDRRTGDFIYKVRPASETSVVFGKIGNEGMVIISDSEVRINTETMKNVIIRNNRFSGDGVGVSVSKGAVGVGGRIPDKLKGLLIRVTK